MDPEPGPAERRGVAKSSQPAGASRLGAEDSRGARAAWPGRFPGARAAAPAVSPSQPSDAVRLAGILWLRRSAARGPPLSSLSFNRENEESLGSSSSAPGPGVRVLYGSDLRKGGSPGPEKPRLIALNYFVASVRNYYFKYIVSTPGLPVTRLLRGLGEDIMGVKIVIIEVSG